MLDWICSSFFCRSETLAASPTGAALTAMNRQRTAVTRLTARRSRPAGRGYFACFAPCFACFAVFTPGPPFYTFRCLRMENRLPSPPTMAPPATLADSTVVHTDSSGTSEVPTSTSHTPLRVPAAPSR